VVNKIRSEVDVEAEVIIGAITDPSLDGKIRVSIVATSLDGQQPEAKSVINMVHRIQNRNPGYSDFSNIGPTPSFNFSNNSPSPISHGANALKLENEVTSENQTESINQEDINQVNNQYHEELLKNQQAESIVENTSNGEEVSFTEEATQDSETSLNGENTNNDLSEFGVDSDAP
jgi:cell division protein FtsZ